MIVTPEHSGDEQDQKLDALLTELAGTTFEMGVEAPIIVDLGGGPVELVRFPVRFVVSVAGDAFQLFSMTLNVRRPSEMSAHSWMMCDLPMEQLRNAAPDFARLIEDAVNNHCHELIEEAINNRFQSSQGS